jgi:hypothetical protein
MKNKITKAGHLDDLIPKLEAMIDQWTPDDSKWYPCVARLRQNLETEWVKTVTEAKVKQNDEINAEASTDYEEAKPKLGGFRCGSNLWPNALCARCWHAVLRFNSEWAEEALDERGALRAVTEAT